MSITLGREPGPYPPPATGAQPAGPAPVIPAPAPCAAPHTSAHAAPRAAAHAARRRSRPGPLGYAWRAIAWAMIAIVAAVVVAGAIVPRIIHAVPLTVLTGSMRPGIQPGDLLIVRPVTSADFVAVGDVVTFQPLPDDPALITHRVVAVTTAGGHVTGLTTRGDANGADDEPIEAAQVQGTLLYRLPKAGWFASWMTTGRSWFVTIAIIALFAYAAYSLTRGRIDAARARRRERGPR